MAADATLADLAETVGIFPRFKDMQGVIRTASVDTTRALLRAQGFEVETANDVKLSLEALKAEAARAIVAQDVVVEAGKPASLSVKGQVNWHIAQDQTATVLADGHADGVIALPPLPIGIHQFTLKTKQTQQTANLLVAPSRAPSVKNATGQSKLWGCMTALYGLGAEGPKSLGDFADLGHLARALGAQGAGFVGINPVHALGYAANNTISPYSPTHRGFLNSDHIALGQSQLPGATGLIDYAAHRSAHHSALEAAFAAFEQGATDAEQQAFTTFCADEGARLGDFALFEALSEAHGQDCRQWPHTARKAQAAQAPAERVRFHKWLQWRAHTGLSDAQRQAQDSGMALGLYLDLAVGARAGGAESWGSNAATAQGVTLGAPPDHLSPAGQDWQLAALAPRKLQQTGYAALRQVLRASMRHCGLLRVDHALGLNRSYWIPEDGSPGGYIRQNFESLIAVIAIEAARHGTVVVGEDLGLVPEGFRDTMASCGFYGYSVLQYEKDAEGAFLPADKLRVQSLACFATHDTPTLAGFWEGSDIAWWEKLGWITSEDAARSMNSRMSEKRDLIGVPAPTPVPSTATQGVRDEIHSTLAGSPAALVAVQLDDILLVKEAQNLPGTVDEHPNWRRRTPLPITDIAKHPDLKKTAAIMAGAGRASQMRKERK
ncbi:MAG: 4-alpha-glucanotransferase [Roseobacter sp.]